MADEFAERPDAARDSGFSLAEMLVALVLTLLLSGAALLLVNTGTITAQTQPDAADTQQRARIGADTLAHDLRMAGAGVNAGPATGALSDYFAPLIPRNLGRQNPDSHTVARADALTVIYVPSAHLQTTIQSPMTSASTDLLVTHRPNCPRQQALCGFKTGMSLVVFDDQARFDAFTLTDVQGSVGRVENHHQPVQAGSAYPVGAVVAEAAFHTYYLDSANRQLRHDDGYLTDVPVVDNVVGLQFEYFGDPGPPFVPKPPVGIANCLYDAAGQILPGMAVLPLQGASLAALPLSMLSDGPWCGEGLNRFDADLLRIRKVRVTLRVQAGNEMMRGTSSEFSVAGKNRTALRSLPDYTIQFEVSPRNMNLGR